MEPVQTSQPEQTSKNFQLYNNLIGSKKVSADDIGNFDQFNTVLQDSAKASKTYDNFITDGRLTAEDIGNKDQSEFHFSDVSGTLVGFFTPAFMASLNVPGLHLHFLSQDRQQGGHLLECRVKKVRAEIQFLYTLELSLPVSLDYLTWDFQRDIRGDLDKAEK